MENSTGAVFKREKSAARGNTKISQRGEEDNEATPRRLSHFRGDRSASREQTAEVEERDVRLSGGSRVNVVGDPKDVWGGVPSQRTTVAAHLLLVAQEVGELVGGQVILPVAVGHHQQEDVPSQGHHLVEDGELLVSQRALLVVGVGLLRVSSRGDCFFQ